ncbi:complement component 1, q subcomponent-like 4 like precursor [Silurus asotus]|uniref:Complement component 1, q subcomponent-like 4 like n=1 Tax=Silurus asotus TaxID=30991 RepID=A0AAD5FE11_SILAS|nr:complement component 1, q subcomponent-like 4 like precursor [Silurus asotus]
MSPIGRFVLLLCACCVYTQDFMEPSVNVLEEIAKIRGLEERMKNMEEALQRQSNVVTELTSTLRDVMNENAVLKTTLHENLEKLQTANEGRKVAFSASLLASGSGHEGPYETVPSPLIYKKVVTNYGNGYDSNTGIFTAPVRGVYYFRFYAHCHADNRMAVSLYKNGNIQCSVFSWKPITNGNASNGIILTLEKGDQMFTKLWQNSWVYDDPAGYTSFSGFLLFPL